MKPIEIIGLIIAFISMIAAILALVPRSDNPPPVSATPATPIVVALRDLDIRQGPGAEFTILGILSSGNTLDVMGITADRLWYQVLLSDGRRGWVLASSTGARLEGDRGIVAVIVPTETPTLLPPLITTVPPSPIPIPTATNMPPLPTPQATNTAVLLPDRTYPCDAVVDPNSPSTTLNVVREFPNNTSTTVGSVRRSDNVTIIERSAGTDVYYRIQSGGRTLGWIAEEHLELSSTCP